MVPRLKGYKARLDKAGHDDADLPFRNANLITQCETFGADATELVKDAKKAIMEKFGVLREKYNHVLKQVEDMQPHVNNQISSLLVKLNDCRTETLQKYQTDYWKVKRYNDNLITGGHFQVWAKQCTEAKFKDPFNLEQKIFMGTDKLVCVNPQAAEDFSTQVVTIFRGGEGILIQKIRGLMNLKKSVNRSED